MPQIETDQNLERYIWRQAVYIHYNEHSIATANTQHAYQLKIKLLQEVKETTNNHKEDIGLTNARHRSMYLEISEASMA